MTDAVTLKAHLAEAEEALHALRLGRAVAQVRTVDGRQVSYAAADRADLAAYVRSLRLQLGLRPRRGAAIGVRFR